MADPAPGREPARYRCAPSSLDRAEPLVGTASRVQRWLIVEQPGAWGPDPPLDSRLDHDVASALVASARRHRVRVLLVRRPGDRRRGGDRRVFLAHSGAERRWIEQLTVRADRARDMLGIDLGVLAFPEPPGLGEPGPDTLNLVCTNGRHDPCCADFGRPVVRALTAAGSPDVWESSHVGGDRFAANLVCLPDGVYYGRVEADEAARLVADHRAGVLDLARYRGRSCHPPLVQAADLFAREHLGERRVEGVMIVSTERHDDGTVTVLVQQRPGHEHEGATLEVLVRRERAPAVRLTCHADEPDSPWSYLLVDVRPA
jgi:hypothetical protein